MNKIKIIDCTIRDGGHLNNWNFSQECVRDSYYTALKSGIDFFEIGYRNYYNCNYGKFYTSEDEFLIDLLQPDENCKISVMSDMGKSDIDLFKICDRKYTPVSAVFVATYLKDLKESFLFCEKLFDKGYMVFLNLMAVFEYCSEDFEILAKWKNKHILESICFADSFGSFFPDDIILISEKLKSTGFENISFHAHNNLQLAFSNVLKAIDLGLYSIDASAYGMGRDAGNLPMELLLHYMNKFDTKYNPLEYLKLVEKYYIDIHNSNPWGYNLNSLVGGIKSVHPKYIKELTKNSDLKEVWDVSDKIYQNKQIPYNEEIMKQILSDIKNKESIHAF